MLSFLDLSAAFDTVDHGILMQRLSFSFGMGGFVLDWIRSYLEGRTQYVSYDGAVSTTTVVLFGVPQGSILDPLAFNLYTSEIIQLIRGAGLNVHAYADDLQVYGHTTPSESSILQTRISDCIESIREWMRSNRLWLNPTKTEFIWVGSSNCLGKFQSTDPIRVSGELVAPVKKVRDLGVIIDSELTLIPHVDSVVKQCFFHLRQLRLIRRSLTNDTTHALVRALVHSRLDYCNGVLAGLPINQVNRLQSILRAAARLVLRLPGRASVTDRMKDDLHWLDVSKRITFKHCVLAFKCQTGLTPSYLTSSCVSSSTVPSRVSLRSASTNTMLLPRTRTKTIGPRGFFYSCPAAWNNLSSALRILDQSLFSFQEKPENVSFSKLILL